MTTFNLYLCYPFQFRLSKKLAYLLVLLCLSTLSFATHNRSGSITYRHLYGYTYEFTVITCTKSSSDADRPSLEINWGDLTKDTIFRDDPNIEYLPIYDVQINTYRGIHTYTGPDTYIISIEDPNRNAGVVNISNSVDKVFCIQTELTISPFLGTPNNSLVIEDCPCPEFACVNQVYCYNLSAYDPDGDSLSYSLVPCRGEDCLEMSIPAIYNYPHEVGGGVMSIDPVTGTLCWDTPQIQGEYNLAIKISEWRNGIYLGSVIQDMQLTVQDCNNEPPVLAERPDTCVYAGTFVDIGFTATDASDQVTVYATGAVFNLPSNPAQFNDSTGQFIATGHFIWTPDCEQADNDYYSVIIHAEDDDDIQLADLTTFRIKVNIPPVHNLTVTPSGNTMQITWQDTSCSPIDHYNIYRSTDSTNLIDNCCEPGTPESMGYSYIGMSPTTSFLDPGPLVVGNDYCYMVTAVNSSGVESCVSAQVCNHLNFEIPVLTNVSVIITDPTAGRDTIIWAYPKELDTMVFTGPYHYELYRQSGYGGGTESLVYTSPNQTSIINPDTIFYDNNQDTENEAHTYRVELYSGPALVGSSVAATSIYLTTIPNDNQIALSWIENVPWTNSQYEIYRESSPGSGVFNLIATTNSIGYTDSNLINGSEYCYKVKTIGQYSSSGIASPLINWSQEVCEVPVDLTAPCPPELFIDGDCELEETYLSWTNPNNSCADDVTRYNLYFAPFSGDSLELLTSFSSDLDTFFVHADRGSIAGCYYVTALDSVQYNNESEPSNLACIDNCDGYYELPNVFTPDNNNANDTYHPILPIKFVDSVDFKVYNRWGELVFETNDPLLNWDGTSIKTNKKCNDGVYFYVITIYEIKLEGLVPKSAHGNITIINSH